MKIQVPDVDIRPNQAIHVENLTFHEMNYLPQLVGPPSNSLLMPCVRIAL